MEVHTYKVAEKKFATFGEICKKIVKMVWIYRETDVTPHGCATNYAMVLQTIVFHAREVANKAC